MEGVTRMPRTKKTTRDAILKYLSENPNATNKQVAEKLKCTVSYVWMLRKQMGGAAQVAEKAQEAPKVDVDALLDERGLRYGTFRTHAEITQLLKRVVSKYLHNGGKELDFDQQEALDMIFHKVGRIVGGDPDYVDSWADIAGYATLVVDRLKGKER
jgi:DNA-binding CsgD family transcriptional regulator